MEILGYDFDTILADGSDNITSTILNLLNSYPDLNGQIEFQVLDTTKGIAMFASPSVAIISEVEDVTAHVTQVCAYSFSIVYRTRSTDREYVKEWLDNLGRWLEQTELPTLSGGKEFTKISRTSQSSLYNITEDKAEDWSINIQATYRNEFDR